MKSTSLEIYRKIKDSGVIKGQQLMVYEILARQRNDNRKGKIPSGLTAHEMRNFAGILFNVKNTESLPKRLSELERLGCIMSIGARKCRITKNTCTEWVVNGQLPIKNKKDTSLNVENEGIINLIEMIKQNIFFSKKLLKCTPIPFVSIRAKLEGKIIAYKFILKNLKKNVKLK